MLHHQCFLPVTSACRDLEVQNKTCEMLDYKIFSPHNLRDLLACLYTAYRLDKLACFRPIREGLGISSVFADIWQDS